MQRPWQPVAAAASSLRMRVACQVGLPYPYPSLYGMLCNSRIHYASSITCKPMLDCGQRVLVPGLCCCTRDFIIVGVMTDSFIIV